MQLSIPQILLMSRLLDEALPLDADGRRLWLEQLSAEYQDLVPALRNALLAPPEAMLDAEARDPDAEVLQAGTRIGPYELIRPLGAGGMAQVWLARRADGAFRRDVALKLPALTHRRKDLTSRFHSERDILASLEHPLIARFYDAGIDANGLPYLAMEYVHGRPLTIWSDTQQLGVPARLELFLQVLEAVQYAHEKHVVHRDLKPTNILVTGSGQVRLLDFGVAKLLEADDAAASQLTHVYGRALTPAYASPELLGGAPVDARSDIYSLGVVLYELLSGARPDGLTHGTPAVELKRPSTQVDQAATSARATTMDRLTRQLRGDLDAIALKCLAREPAERYPSASALADDLRRYLAGQPVTARPAALPQRLGKAMRRNKGLMTIAAAAIAVIAVALGYALQHPATLSGVAAARPAPGATPAPVRPPNSAGPSLPIGAPEKSIAVLPFVDMSEKHDQEYFSDGLAAELIDQLTHSPSLKVIARSSSFQFKGRDEDVRLIAARLGVAHLLEGSVRKSGQTVRVTTELIRASDGVNLWSKTYDGTLANIFQVQDEISEKVARALNATLASSARPAGDPADVEAYNLVLEGDYYQRRRTRSNVDKALQLYQQAIRLRPRYALPWWGLGNAYLRLEEQAGVPSADYNARILGALDRAIQLDPTLIWSYYTRAGFELAMQWDWAAAQADHERMRALDPSSHLLPPALGGSALIAGRADEAVRQYRRALELDPLDADTLQSLGDALCASGHLPECLQSRLTLQQLHPELPGVSALVGQARLLLAQLPQALDAMQKEPDEESRLAGLAMVYSALGKRIDSDRTLETLEARYPAQDAYDIAEVYAYRGEVSEAFNWLQRCVQLHNAGILYIKLDPFLGNLRGDARYRALLAQLRLPAQAS